MKSYEITSFRGALSDYEDKGIPGAFKFGSGLDIRKEVDSLSCGQALVEEGLISSASPSASPSPSPSVTPSPSYSASPSLSGSASPSPSVSASPSPSAGLTTVFEGLIHFFVKCSNGYTYGFDDTGCVYRRDADAFWQRVYKDPDGAIKGAAEWYSDAGKTYLYWATDTKLHRKELPGLDNWNDVDADDGWPKENLVSADWHTMREAGGALVIANGPYLAMVGYDSSYTNEALDLILGNIAKTIVERSGRTIVGTIRASDEKGINAAIDTEYPLAQIGDDGELFSADMVNSMPLKRFPGGGKVNPGGVANEVEQANFFEWDQNALSWIDKQAMGNMSLWGVFEADSSKGGIYTYGRRNKNHPFVLNLEYLLDVDEIGAVTNIDGVTLASYKDGSDYGVVAVDSTTKAQGIWEGLDLKAPKTKKPINITNWKTAEIFCAPLPDGANIKFYYKANKTGDWVQAKTADGDTEFDTANGKKAVFNIGAEGEIFEPRLVLNPTSNSSPEVYRLRIYFDHA